jgi:hypothetical protein
MTKLCGTLLFALGSASQLLDARMSVSLEASVPSPTPVGTLVTWTAAVEDSAPGRYFYRFVTRGFDERRRIVKDFGPDNTLEWAAGEREGFYTVEVVARNRDTGETAVAVAPYDVRSNAAGGDPVVSTTAHPLVMLYSAPPCPAGAFMTVYFLSPDQVLQNTPARRCDGIFSMNFYLAGLRAGTSYFVKHIVEDRGLFTEGPVMTFVSGNAPDGLPTHRAVVGSSPSRSQPVMLAGSLFTNFVATDLEGDLIWYYPKLITFLTHPERGGYFFGLHEDESGDQSRQILRMFDVAGVTVFETNAARINEQLEAAGKRAISAFHHEARLLSDGRILTLASVEQIMNDVQGPGPVNILGDMILVLNRDLEVVWTWDAFDHLDVRRLATQFDRCVPGVCPPLFLSTEANDWLHGNAVTETPDGNLLYSMRSQDWVIKIDYNHGTGSGGVLWRLGKDGDFRLDSSDPNPWFSHQHDPEMEAGGLLSVFDNGNVRRAADDGSHSRGQVFQLDEQRRTASLVLNADPGEYAFALGSVQKLETGNYFLDVGYRNDGTGISVEVDPSGHVVYAIESTAPEYRTFRMKSMYNP